MSAAALLMVSYAGADAHQPSRDGASYYENSSHPDAWSGGARKLTISTPKGPNQVWIKRVGNNPKLKLLLLTGGPGFSHAYMEVMDSFLPAEGVEYESDALRTLAALPDGAGPSAFLAKLRIVIQEAAGEPERNTDS